MRFGPYVAAKSRLGTGAQSVAVLAGYHRHTALPVAVKLEKEDTPRPKMPNEAAFYRDLDRRHGFPSMLWYGRAHGYLALVMDRLGPSLRTLQRNPETATLDAPALRHIADQTLQRLQTIHELGWLHCDVKPANLLLLPNANRAQAVVEGF